MSELDDDLAATDSGHGVGERSVRARHRSDKRGVRAILKSINSKTPDNDSVLHVFVEDIDVPFGRMVVLLIKFWFATLITGLFIFCLFVIISALTGGSLLALFGRR